MGPGHHWFLKFEQVAGSMNYVEKEFILGPRKFEEYKGRKVTTPSWLTCDCIEWMGCLRSDL